MKPLPTDGTGYLLYHSIGMYHGKAEEMQAAFHSFVQNWGAFDDSQWMNALGKRAQFLTLWGKLIEAEAGTLTSAENVTTALYSVIGSLPENYLQDRTILVAADCFPSLHFLLAGLAPRLGFTLKTVPLRPNEYWVRDEDMIAAWDKSVGVALLTSVASTSSHRCDLEALIAHGRKQGSLIGVDITQGAGLIPYSVSAIGADFTVSSTLKWLCGTPGAGIIHMQSALLQACKPELRGWFSQENIFSWDLDSFEYAGDARRFDHGTPSVLACIGSVPALEWHARQDLSAQLTHNRNLGAMIIKEASNLGLKLASPAEEAKRGGSLMIRLPEQVHASELIERLRKIGIFTDSRGTVMRLSPGSITKEEGITRLFKYLRDEEGLKK